MMMMMLIKIALSVILIFNFAKALPTKRHGKPNSGVNYERLNHLGRDELAEELSGHFEGDIVISSDELNELLKTGIKTGLIDTSYRWINNTVPYQIKEDDFNSFQIEYVHAAVKKLQDVTCLTFVPYNSNVHTNYIWVTGESGGCWSSVGMRGGRQQLNLQPYDLEVGCFRLYTIVHEFIHALGFYHMQSATERDDYVKIIWENIQQGSEHNFNKYDSNTISLYDVEYDYESVMHYSATAFTVNGERTIVPIRELQDGVNIGQRDRMSDKDIARINSVYCSDK